MAFHPIPDADLVTAIAAAGVARASHSTTVSEDEASAAAALYAQLRTAGAWPMDCLLALARRDSAVIARFES